MLFAAFIMTAVKSQAQTTDAGKWRLGFGVEGGIPTGDFKGYSNFELGGTARLQYRASQIFTSLLLPVITISLPRMLLSQVQTSSANLMIWGLFR